MFKLIRFLKGYIPATIFAPLCKLIEAIMELAVPMIIAEVIDKGLASKDTSFVITYCSLIGIFAVAGFLISVTGQYLASKVALGFGTKLRNATFSHINALPLSTVDRMGGASLVTRVTGDVVSCQNALNMFLRLVLRMPFVVVGAFVMSMIIDPVLSLMFLAMTIVLGATISLALKLTMPHVKRAQKQIDAISHSTAQSIAGARVIRAFSKQRETKNDFNAVADDTAKTNFGAALRSALLTPLTFAVVNLAIIAVLWLGGAKVQIGTLTQGKTVALINYLQQAFFVIVNIGNVFSVFTRSSACAARVNEILDAPRAPDGTITAVPDCEHVLSFKDVSFAYDGDYDVRDISFTLDRGKTLGIIGGTGSGKSTIIALAEKFYTPDKGVIEFCGVPLNDYKISCVRGCIGYVPQRPAVLGGTLMSNLQIANATLTEDGARRAMALAQATELWDSLGADGVIENDGRNLSGGQRQRVGIARSLCRDNILYLFDDVTSALDYRTERNFINAVNGVDGAKIFVSQRISTVRGCDNILVLDGGAVVGYGTHSSLLADCPLYAELNASQNK